MVRVLYSSVLQKTKSVSRRLIQMNVPLLFKRKNEVWSVLQFYWVIGFYNQKKNRDFFREITDRCVASLEIVILENEATASTLYTNVWRSYINESKMGYTHR